MSTSCNLPKINPQISQRKVFLDLPMYDSESRSCHGYVSLKYADEAADLSPSAFPAHLLEIDLRIDDDKNYNLKRYSVVENNAETPVTYKLAGSRVVPIAKTCFEFHPKDGTPLTVWTTSSKICERWIKTIANVTLVANQREILLGNMVHKEDVDTLNQNTGQTTTEKIPFGLLQDLGGVYSKIDRMIGLIAKKQ